MNKIVSQTYWRTALISGSRRGSRSVGILGLVLLIAFCVSLDNARSQSSLSKELFFVPYGQNEGSISFESSRADRGEEQEVIPAAPTLRVKPDGQRFLLMYRGLEKGSLEAEVYLFDQNGKRIKAIQTGSPEDCALIAGKDRFYIFYGKRLISYDWEGKVLREISSQFTEMIQQSQLTFVSVIGEDNSEALYFKVLDMSRPRGQRIVTWRAKLPDETRLIDGIGSVHAASNTFWKQSILESNPSSTLQTGYRLDGTVDFQEESEAYSGRKIEVLSSTGEIVRTFFFPANDLSEEERSMLFYSLNDKVSSSGRLFVTTEKLTMREVRRGSWLFQSGFQVVEYDSHGRYMGIRAYLLEPVGSVQPDGLSRLWDIDSEGNLYYLDFQADHLKVMKVPAR